VKGEKESETILNWIGEGEGEGGWRSRTGYPSCVCFRRSWSYRERPQELNTIRGAIIIHTGRNALIYSSRSWPSDQFTDHHRLSHWAVYRRPLSLWIGLNVAPVQPLEPTDGFDAFCPRL